MAGTLRLEGPWAGGPLAEKERHELYDTMTKWYYATSGGIYLSPTARRVYLKAKVNLRCPAAQIRPEGALDEFRDAQTTDEARGELAIRKLSLLHWVMRCDLKIYTQPYNTTLSRKEIEFLDKVCEVRLKRRPLRGNWKAKDQPATWRVRCRKIWNHPSRIHGDGTGRGVRE